MALKSDQHPPSSGIKTPTFLFTVKPKDGGFVLDIDVFYDGAYATPILRDGDITKTSLDAFLAGTPGQVIITQSGADTPGDASGGLVQDVNTVKQSAHHDAPHKEHQK